jgi:starch-binding outer membrane protein SusE/F
MKKILQSLIYLSLAIVFFASCEKDEARDTYVGGNAPVFSASVKDSIGLNFNTENDRAVTFSWTNPNYQFASGVSSQNVNYSLEIDTAGANFNGANKKTVSISQDLSISYTQKAFNILISDLKVKAGKVAQLEMRVIASLGNTATNLVSNKLTFKVLPYAPPPKVPVPTAGTLWVTGSAFASGWSNPLVAPFVTSQKFTKVSDTQYELVVDMLSSGNYKLIQENGVWGTQYKKLTGDAYSGTFEKKDADPGFDAPAVAGRYKLVFDFQSGTYTVTKQ